MPFANDFAGSKESRNYFAALIEYMSARIRSKPAQCSADSRHDVNGIQLAFVEWFRQFFAAEVFIFAVLDEFRVALHRLRKGRFRKTEFLS